jgi:O-antigen ligase
LAPYHNRLLRTAPADAGSVGASSEGVTRWVIVRSREDIPRLIRWLFLLFAFTLPFQSTDLPFTSGTLSIGRISGLLFFGSFCFYYNALLFRKKSFPHPPNVLWWFVVYVGVYALSGFFIPEESFDEFRTGLTTLIQLLVLLWCASWMFTEERTARNFLLSFSIATGIVALGIILHVPGFSVPEDAERVTAFGTNANSIALLMSVGAVIFVGLYLKGVCKRFVTKTLVVVLIVTLMAVMVKTGSRGGVLAFMIGCLTYGVPFLRFERKWAGIVLVSFFTAAIVYLAVSSPVFLERVQATYYEGSLAQRENIYPLALEMILERPLLGWQPSEYIFELGRRLRTASGRSDAHNLFLHLLLEVGLLGTIPFLIGLWVCGWAAWKARSAHLGLLPLALLLTLVAGNMSGTGIRDKTLWLGLGLGVATERALARGSRKKFALVLEGRV